MCHPFSSINFIDSCFNELTFDLCACNRCGAPGKSKGKTRTERNTKNGRYVFKHVDTIKMLIKVVPTETFS